MNLSMKFALIAFNVTVMLIAFPWLLLHQGVWTGWGATGAFFLLFLLGSIAAAITYKLTSGMKE